MMSHAGNCAEVRDGAHCVVVAGMHSGKSGVVRDRKISKTGHVTITVEQENGVRLKTLGKNVRAIQPDG